MKTGQWCRVKVININLARVLCMLFLFNFTLECNGINIKFYLNS